MNKIWKAPWIMDTRFDDLTPINVFYKQFQILIEDIIGLNPAKPGWEEITFTPHLPKSLRHITLEIPTVQGKIRVDCTDRTVNIQTPYGVSLVNSAESLWQTSTKNKLTLFEG